MSEMMKGVVEMYNVTKGVGFIRGEDGQKYFVAASDIVTLSRDLRFLAPNWKVEFKPGGSRAQGFKAFKVTCSNKPGLRTNPLLPIVQVDEKGVALRIDSLGRIYVLSGSQAASPTLELEGQCRAYFLGLQHFVEFDLELPESTANRVFVLLDINKQPRRPRFDNIYSDAAPGSYLLILEANGLVRIWNLGRRIQGQKSEQWAVIEKRFEHQYDLAGDIMAQTPNSGLARDNDQFVRGIERAALMVHPVPQETVAQPVAQ